MIKKHVWDAGWDLISDHEAIVGRENITVIHTGIKADIPQGHVGLILGRSGLARDHGIFTLGGVIDASYTGEIQVLLSKVGEEAFPVRRGDRIAQLVVVPLSHYTPMSSSSRGANGFGSTGVVG